MKAKYTQGEWQAGPTATGGNMDTKYNQSEAIFSIEDRTLIAGCFRDVKGGEEVAKANAKLIAAAPDLLEAVEKLKPLLGGLLSYVQEHCPLDLGQHDMVVMAYNQAEKAIKKATE